MTFTRRRTLDAEFRSALPDMPISDSGEIHGYGAVFNQRTRIREAGGAFLESVTPGAFTKTLAERMGKIAMQYNHGQDPKVGTLPIGVWDEISQDSHGLAMRGRLLDTAAAQEVRSAIKAGALTGMSFRFEVMNEIWRDRATGEQIDSDRAYSMLGDSEPRLLRELTAVRLYEVGPVLQPAYETTSVGARAEDIPVDTIEIQTRLRLALAQLDN
ncbi:HK97 family phage prohead protease [Nocardia nova]|uniref:HK97 family phage prohead protease n=1 Tax=Nocardia nova TaxID=37330 RepID=UPI0033D5423A